MKEFAVYTVARFGVFLATYGIVAGLYLLVTGGDSLPLLWPLLLAAVLSTAASTYLLRGMRDRFALQVQRRAERMSARFEEMRSKEDHD